jgi:hypothetical protein
MRAGLDQKKMAVSCLNTEVVFIPTTLCPTSLCLHHNNDLLENILVTTYINVTTSKHINCSLSLLHTGPMIQLLLNHNVLASEDLLGIEHLVMKNPALVLDERCSHVDWCWVLRKQCKRVTKMVGTRKLTVLAIARTSESFRKARLRLALALDD